MAERHKWMPGKEGGPAGICARGCGRTSKISFGSVQLGTVSSIKLGTDIWAQDILQCVATILDARGELQRALHSWPCGVARPFCTI